VTQTVTRFETLGPLTTKIKGSFQSATAGVTGVWDGHTALPQNGMLEDTQNTTVQRDVTLQP